MVILFVCAFRAVEQVDPVLPGMATSKMPPFRVLSYSGAGMCAREPSETGCRRAVVHMNDLIYKARMALKDVMEVKIFTQGSGKVYLAFFPHLFWEGTGQTHKEKIILKIIDCLRDMGMDLAGGESAITTLLNSEAVEIVSKAA
jgi:hypothetical protein